MICNNCASTQQTEQSIVNHFEQFEPCTEFFEHPNGYFLPLDLTQSIHTQIEMRLHEMEPGSTYSLKNICGKTFWKNLTKQERRLAYNCVDFLIEYEDLPLEPIEFDEKKDYLIY